MNNHIVPALLSIRIKSITWPPIVGVWKDKEMDSETAHKVAMELHRKIEELEQKYNCVIAHATWGYEITMEEGEKRNPAARYVNVEYGGEE